ncbi:MAG: ABC transporter permease [Bryobacteraceae bacterium]|nr:ABC transporter permease [Bryobacteraceae bacterium]
MIRLRTMFLLPGVAVLLSLFVAPLAIIFLYSLQSRGVYGGVSLPFTLSNYARLFDSLYGWIFLRTVLVSLVATLGCLLLAFPLALFISRSGKRRNLYLQLVMLPFWSSFLVRTYAWMFLLRDTGLINTALVGIGLVGEPLPLLNNDGAVLIGLVYGYLPFAVLPLYATLERLDHSLIEAAADLGANPWDTLRHVVLPLCAPGFRAAAILVFIPCLGAYLTPDLLGGGKSVMAGNLIQNQFTTSRDWPFGSAIALVMMALSIVLLALWMRRREQAESAL